MSIVLVYATDRDDSALGIYLFAGKPNLPAHFVITDPSGKPYGSNGKKGIGIVDEHRSYGPDEAIEGKKMLQYTSSELKTGTYVMTIYGIETSTFTISIYTRDMAGKRNFPIPDETLTMLLSDTTCDYQLDYDVTPNGKRTTFSKVVTPDILRNNLVAAQKLSKEKNNIAFNSWLEKITEAQKQNKGDAKKTLQKLEEEISKSPILHPQISQILVEDIKTYLKR